MQTPDNSLEHFTFGTMYNSYKKLLTAVTLFLAFSFVAKAQPQRAVADKILAIVGDRIILQSDIVNSLTDMERQGQKLPDSASCLLAQQAIISKMLMLQAEKDSLPVTDEEVEAELEQRVRYFVQQVGTIETLEEMAGKSVFQIKEEARESVRERKLSEAMQRKIVENVKITPVEVKAFFDKIPADSLPFYESELEIGQVIAYPKVSRDIEEYIINEMNGYRRQVESGSISFAQLAKNVTEDPGSKERGGLYEINKNDKSMDPVFISTSFRLKAGETSPPVKGKFGYHIIKLEERDGDNAIVRHILRKVPVTEAEINQSITHLDSVRRKIVNGETTFNEAAFRYSEKEEHKFSGPYTLGGDGSTYVTIDLLDKEMVTAISKLQVGEYSQPVAFTDDPPLEKQGVRIIYLKSRTEPHRMNLKDDYSRIAKFALEEKKNKEVEKWMQRMMPTYYIMVDKGTAAECPQLSKYSTTTDKGF